VVIAPWLCGDDHKRLTKLQGKYLFGHLELPGYLMNAMVAMPEHGEFRTDQLSHFEHCFTGHFHKRQTRKNVTYIGNAFPHNYADAGDDDRGLTILEWGKEPEYHAWPNQPTYRVFQLSDVITHAETMLKPGMHVRVNLDIDISYEESTFIKEEFAGKFNLREITLIPAKTTDLTDYEIQGNIEFESVDQIVSNQLTNIESDKFNKALLLDIYRNL
jgi:hypothetical protein